MEVIYCKCSTLNMFPVHLYTLRDKPKLFYTVIDCIKLSIHSSLPERVDFGLSEVL